MFVCVSGENQKSKKKKASVLHLTIIIIIYFVFHINQIGYRYYCMLFMKSVCLCVCVQCEWPKKIKTRQVVLEKKIWSSHFESSSQVVVCVCVWGVEVYKARSVFDRFTKQAAIYSIVWYYHSKKNFYVFYVYNKCISKWQDPINLLNFISTLFVSKKMSFIH